MRLRRVAPAAGLLVALTLTACTSDGEESASSSPRSTGASTGSELASTVRTGVAKLTSAHFTLSGTLSGAALSGSGDQKIDNGTLTGLQAQATLPAVGAVGIVVDGAQRYVRVPPPLATAAKPWLRVSTDSKNIIVQQFAGLLDAALAAADLGGIADLAMASTSGRRVGSEPVGGVPANRYSFTVAPASLANKAAAAALGNAAVPVDLWVDGRDRPVKVHAKVAVVGQPVEVTVVFSEFDAPVTITAPPESQIAAG